LFRSSLLPLQVQGVVTLGVFFILPWLGLAGVILVKLSLTDFEHCTRLTMQLQLKQGLDTLRRFATCFASWKRRSVRAVVKLCQIVEAKAGETLFQHGHVSDRMYFVLSGTANIVRRVKVDQVLKWPTGTRNWEVGRREKTVRIAAAQYTVGAVLGAEIAQLLPKERVKRPNPLAHASKSATPCVPLSTRSSDSCDSDSSLFDLSIEMASDDEVSASHGPAESRVEHIPLAVLRNYDAIALTEMRLLSLQVLQIEVLQTEPGAVLFLQRQAEKECSDCNSVDTVPGPSDGVPGFKDTQGSLANVDAQISRISDVVSHQLHRVNEAERFCQVVESSSGPKYAQRFRKQRKLAILSSVASQCAGATPGPSDVVLPPLPLSPSRQLQLLKSVDVSAAFQTPDRRASVVSVSAATSTDRPLRDSDSTLAVSRVQASGRGHSGECDHYDSHRDDSDIDDILIDSDGDDRSIRVSCNSDVASDNDSESGTELKLTVLSASRSSSHHLKLDPTGVPSSSHGWEPEVVNGGTVSVSVTSVTDLHAWKPFAQASAVPVDACPVEVEDNNPCVPRAPESVSQSFPDQLPPVHRKANPLRHKVASFRSRDKPMLRKEVSHTDVLPAEAVTPTKLSMQAHSSKRSRFAFVSPKNPSPNVARRRHVSIVLPASEPK
jgi:hypothetical protein